MVSALLCVASPSAENPQDCNEGTTGVSASPRGPRRVLQPDHGVHSPASFPLFAYDLGHTKDIWKLCIIGYVVGKFLGYIALNNLISSVWKCSAKLIIYDSRWLIYTFHSRLIRLLFCLEAHTLFLEGHWS